jgi:hypothetical protein
MLLLLFIFAREFVIEKSILWRFFECAICLLKVSMNLIDFNVIEILIDLRFMCLAIGWIKEYFRIPWLFIL